MREQECTYVGLSLFRISSTKLCPTHYFQSTYYSQYLYAFAALAAVLKSKNWNVSIKLYHDDTLSKGELDSWALLVDQWNRSWGTQTKNKVSHIVSVLKTSSCSPPLRVSCCVTAVPSGLRFIYAVSLWICSRDSDLTSSIDALCLMFRSITQI